MGLFGRKINARVREQVKRIFSTTTGSDTGDMSQASEQLGFVVRRNDRWNGNGFQQTQNSSRRELEQVAMVHNSSCVTPNVKSESDQPNSFISGKKSPIYVFKKADSSPTVSKNCTSPNANDNRASLKPTKDHENQAPNSVEVFCSKGTFDINSNEKACICTKVEQMTTLQAGSVLYEWHTTEQKALNGKVVVGTELAPALVDFEPMSPMKMSTGGQGTVVWVHLPSTSMQYALKFKARDGRSEKNWLVERREAKILQKLKHPFIVNTYHIYETDAALFMAFEYLSGGCLWGHIARIGTLPECYAIYYAACILTALSYLHTRGIVYRDMKAENVVLDYRNRPKLIDFGMAKYFPSVRKQMQLDGDSVKKIHPEYPLGKEFIHVPQLNWASPDLDTDIGTDDPPTRYYYAAYLAPEIYNQPAEANHYIDSWGLGYIILEMILGYGIFLPIPWANIKGQHLSPDWHLHLPIEVVEKLTTDCRNIVYKMLVRQPQKRLSLKSAMRHAFFSRVPWPSLPALTGPDLSRFCNSEDFYQQRLALNSLDFHFGRWSKYYTSKKFYNPHVNSTNHFKLRRQCGKDNEDSLSQRNRNKRLSKHIDTCRKASVSNNHGISCTNRKIGNQQDIHLRFRGEVINGPRTVDLLKKKQGKKQRSM
ncbi:Protein kinase 3 [Echinococcus granulosus]|nr:Protein kinase 3 [Echinococcus granulosus]